MPSNSSAGRSASTPCAPRRLCTNASASTSSPADAATRRSARCERAVELVPAQPASQEHAQALAALGTGLSLAWRYEESMVICEQALAVARAVGADAAELRAMVTIGSNLAYLGRAEEGLAQLWLALRLAEERADRSGLQRAHVELTDAMMLLGRPRESARLAAAALPIFRQYALDASTLVGNLVEALVASGDWDEADVVSTAALRAITSNYPHHALVTRGELEVGRGDFAVGAVHYEAARGTLRLARDLATFDTFLAELALWERRWTDADDAVRDGLGRARTREMAQIRVWLAAKGLRAQAELAALARARGDADGARQRVRRARTAAEHRSARRLSVRGGRAERVRLARPRRGRARARPRHRAPRALVGCSRDMAPTRTAAARGVLPLAPSRGPRRRGRAAWPSRRRRCRTPTPPRSGSGPDPCSERSSSSPSGRGSS